MNIRVALGVPLGLAVVGALLVPTEAQAAPSIGAADNAVQTLFQDGGPATCSVSNPSDASSGPFTANGVTSTRTVSSTSTITDTGDATDITNATATGKSSVKATRKGGTLTIAYRGTTTAALDIDQGLGTDCDVTVGSIALAGAELTLTEASWMTVEGTVTRSAAVQFAVERTSAGPTVAHIGSIFGGHGHTRVQVFLPAGDYEYQNVMQGVLFGPQAAGDPTSINETADVTTTFVPAGTATGKAEGTGGTKYLKSPGALNCAKGVLDAKWKQPAGKGANRTVKKATLSVNGHKEKTVSSPSSGQKTTLKNLDTGEEINLKVTLKLKGGGTVTLTRSYLSCS